MREFIYFDAAAAADVLHIGPFRRVLSSVWVMSLKIRAPDGVRWGHGSLSFADRNANHPCPSLYLRPPPPWHFNLAYTRASAPRRANGISTMRCLAQVLLN